MTQHFIIDTDTASDDAVALIMALQWPEVEVDAILVNYGNLPVDLASANARFTVELCGRMTPVYEGAARPLVREVSYAHGYHGPEGMGILGRLYPQRPAAGQNAALELIRRCQEAPGEITLVALGPLTNVAVALALEPRLAQWVRQCYIMGGAANSVGNVTPAAEFNIWCDPEAARLVFHSGMNMLMVGWELCRFDAALSDAEMAHVRSFGTDRARFALDASSQALLSGRDTQPDSGLMLPDPITMAIALDPSVAARRSWHYVDVACADELTRGMTVVDQLGVTGKQPNLEVCWSIDVPKWKEMLYRTLR